jgi:thiol:disulfide interchange protein DsbD
MTMSASQGKSFLRLFLLGLMGGLLALLTPCVWPIIPMTVSFFLKRAKDDRRRGIRDAMLYGLAIIFIYVGLGLLVTLIWGPSSLNALSTNAIFNLFLFALLVIFAASFSGISILGPLIGLIEIPFAFVIGLVNTIIRILPGGL